MMWILLILFLYPLIAIVAKIVKAEISGVRKGLALSELVVLFSFSMVMIYFAHLIFDIAKAEYYGELFKIFPFLISFFILKKLNYKSSRKTFLIWCLPLAAAFLYWFLTYIFHTALYPLYWAIIVVCYLLLPFYFLFKEKENCLMYYLIGLTGLTVSFSGSFIGFIGCFLSALVAIAIGIICLHEYQYTRREKFFNIFLICAILIFSYFLFQFLWLSLLFYTLLIITIMFVAIKKDLSKTLLPCLIPLIIAQGILMCLLSFF